MYFYFCQVWANNEFHLQAWLGHFRLCLHSYIQLLMPLRKNACQLFSRHGVFFPPGYSWTLSLWTELERQRPPWWMMIWTPWESVNARESEGGGTVVLYWLLTTLSPAHGPIHRNTNYSEDLDYIHYGETSHLTSTPGSACVNASFKSAIKT